MKRVVLKRVIAVLIFMIIISSIYKIYLHLDETDFKDHNFINIHSLKESDQDGPFSFAVVSSIKNSNDVFRDRIIPQINRRQDIDFLISTGDSVLDGAEEKYRILNKTLKSLNSPSIIGIGGNEVSDNGYMRYYKHFGPSYFSFFYDKTYFIFLDSTEITSLEIQESWLIEELNKASKYDNIFVVMDKFPINNGNNKEIDYLGGLTRLFSDYGVTSVFYTGDSYSERIIENVRYYSNGKAGGIADSVDYGYLICHVSGSSTSLEYMKVTPSSSSPLVRAWVGLWYGIRSLFFVQFSNIVIVLSLSLIFSLAIYDKISKDTDYYRDFSVESKDQFSNRTLTIAMFTNNYLPFIGGVPISIHRFAGALRRLGHRVVIFSPEYPSGNGLYEDVVRCPLLKYSKTGNFNFAIANIYSPFIKKEFSKYEFDIVHVHHAFWMGKKGLNLGIKGAIPVVLTYHTRLEKYSENLPFGKLIFKNYLSHKMIKRFAQKCDGVIAPTQSAKEYLENVGVSRLKLVMPTGIDIDSYLNADIANVNNIRNRYVNEDEVLLCSVFRLSPEKNAEFIVDGIKMVSDITKTKFKCIIIGDGPEKEALTDKINNIGMSQHIILCGSIPPELIPLYYLASDLFVFSSQSETQGMVLLEAMAGGCPVVCIRSSGTDDVVVDQINGFKTAPDLVEWSDKVSILVDDQILRSQLASNAEVFAHSYSIEALTEKLAAFYKTVILQKENHNEKNI